MGLAGWMGEGVYWSDGWDEAGRGRSEWEVLLDSGIGGGKPEAPEAWNGEEGIITPL